jgi:23S rRNA (cytosine1962-C5)-methyltransferase
LVHAESDGLPGLVVDQYADVIVIQLLSWGVEVLKDEIANALIEITGANSVFERSDVEVRKLEGIPSRVGLVLGKEVADGIQIKENGVNYQVSVLEGQKTGFYLDQRENRRKVRKQTLDQDVLDCFSYSGGFTLNALMGGAKSITSIDTSRDAIELIRKNLYLNNLDENAVEFIEEDVFKQLRLFRDRDRKFDLIILDPPKFAFTRSQVEKASRAYKDINLLAFKLLRPGGKLVSFSCSGGISPDLFQKIIAGAALDAGVEAQVTERLYQDVDHPVALNFPEGAYLKGLVCRVG